MRLLRLPLLLAALLAVLVAAGCGGGSDKVPADAIAVVDGKKIPRSEFDRLLGQAEKSYKAQGRKFPKAGTPEYNSLKNQAVAYLVQRQELDLKAGDMGIEITDEQIDKKLAEIKKSFFNNDEKKYQAQLKQQGLTEEQVRKDIRAQLVQDAIFKKVTVGVKVSDEDVQAYYKKNTAQYTRPESRDVRHILISVCSAGAPKSSGCQSDADAKALAKQVYSQLEGGADFAKLAKKYSDDPGSKSVGGKLTISRGQTVAPFDQTAFLLGKGKISSPIKTQYGYHIIEPLSEIKPKQVTPLRAVREQIRTQLAQSKKNEAMATWVKDMKKDFEGKTTYQVGFAPPAPKGGTSTSK